VHNFIQICSDFTFLLYDVWGFTFSGHSVGPTCCVSKTPPVYICYNFVRCHRIFPIFGRNVHPKTQTSSHPFDTRMKRSVSVA